MLRKEAPKAGVTRCRERDRHALEITLKSIFGESCGTERKWKKESRLRIDSGCS